MKKAIIPIILIALFLFSATTEPSRFATADEMGKALLSALKKNDSLRYIELYPTAKETNAAFVDPWKDSSLYDHQVKWAGKYFLNNNSIPRQMFRETRQDVIAAGYDWKDVEFVSIAVRKETNRSPGIDYLYSADMNLIVQGFKIELRLRDLMKTKDGWNCGLGIKPGVIETQEMRDMEKDMNAAADRMIDSMRMADSISKAIYEQDKYEQEHKKPH